MEATKGCNLGAQVCYWVRQGGDQPSLSWCLNSWFGTISASSVRSLQQRTGKGVLRDGTA